MAGASKLLINNMAMVTRYITVNAIVCVLEAPRQQEFVYALHQNHAALYSIVKHYHSIIYLDGLVASSITNSSQTQTFQYTVQLYTVTHRTHTQITHPDPHTVATHTSLLCDAQSVAYM